MPGPLAQRREPARAEVDRVERQQVRGDVGLASPRGSARSGSSSGSGPGSSAPSASASIAHRPRRAPRCAAPRPRGPRRSAAWRREGTVRARAPPRDARPTRPALCGHARAGVLRRPADRRGRNRSDAHAAEADARASSPAAAHAAAARADAGRRPTAPPPRSGRRPTRGGRRWASSSAACRRSTRAARRSCSAACGAIEHAHPQRAAPLPRGPRRRPVAPAPGPGLAPDGAGAGDVRPRGHARLPRDAQGAQRHVLRAPRLPGDRGAPPAARAEGLADVARPR